MTISHQEADPVTVRATVTSPLDELPPAVVSFVVDPAIGEIVLEDAEESGGT